MYLELVNHYRTTRKYGDDINPRPPAQEKEIAYAEQQMGVCFPQELRDLLSEMNGDCDLLFSIDEILECSKHDFSQNYARGELLFFGSDGAGNLYAYQIKDGQAESSSLVLWDHETDLLCRQASSLKKLIEQYYDLCYGELLADETV